jgi:hypothetical protein
MAVILTDAATFRVQHSLVVQVRVCVRIFNTLLCQQVNMPDVAVWYRLLQKTTTIFQTGQAKAPTSTKQH